jgi:hypothetical protein
LQLLEQLPFTEFCHFIGSQIKSSGNTQALLTLFSLSSQVLRILGAALTSFSYSNYHSFLKRYLQKKCSFFLSSFLLFSEPPFSFSRLGRMVSQMAKFIGGILASEEGIEARQVDREVFWNSHKTSVQAEVDSFFLQAAKVFLSVQDAGLWSFLSSIPFEFLSSDAVWKISIGDFLPSYLSFFLFLLYHLTHHCFDPLQRSLDFHQRKFLKRFGQKTSGIR